VELAVMGVVLAAEKRRVAPATDGDRVRRIMARQAEIRAEYATDDDDDDESGEEEASAPAAASVGIHIRRRVV
jgi:hypothetical protein